MSAVKYLKITIHNPIVGRPMCGTDFWSCILKVSEHYGGRGIMDDGKKVELILPLETAHEFWPEIAYHKDFETRELTENGLLRELWSRPPKKMWWQLKH